MFFWLNILDFKYCIAQWLRPTMCSTFRHCNGLAYWLISDRSILGPPKKFFLKNFFLFLLWHYVDKRNALRILFSPYYNNRSPCHRLHDHRGNRSRLNIWNFFIIFKTNGCRCSIDFWPSLCYPLGFRLRLQRPEWLRNI